MATGRESAKFMLRLPDGMRDQIKEAADKAGRSMNSEVVQRLEESLRFDSLDGWESFRRNALEEKRAEVSRDVEVLSGVRENMVDQIVAGIVAQLTGTESPLSQPVGSVTVRKRPKAQVSKRGKAPNAS